ncbi:unsaturated rhamnogalacturonyl hydrolase [Meinhardsimonia xiamenensis]|uniref:Unsaturated rhamnogalacturonyl hydrolase n=2 Tax=Meinhardsimonia xiamenensis TaxID=990712 RepID=A0A1G9FNS3_9RHOB|nr:glycoside hydrolase family 88 protein [Meinhardsimonia xiamenensis]PRX37754.1 unsaturated rhamnogalacturonyl hydrolase [Meinhardsimonia xiamenensis]SDK90021.1 unsaturated rhamnogalacturonyl hydrolase [Meinhardsimonia xiamenensis]
MIDEQQLRATLDRLVAGLTSLRDEGRFHEPNLDGSRGDYISFHSWEWPQGVGLYGIARLWQKTGEPRLQRLLEEWYEAHRARGLPPMNVNTTAPMLALTLLWARTRDARWKPLLQDWAERLIEEAPRTPEGGFQHDVSDRINTGELWDDTLFMVALFLAAYGEASGQRALVDEAQHQFLVHARFLADPVSGLWFHGWSFPRRDNFARARWARGNAWITAGLADLPELCSLDPAVNRFLQGVLTAQIEALLPLQCEDGAWRTLLDDPGSYKETSATAGIAYGLMKAARTGRAGPAAAAAGRRGLAYVLSQIGPDGVVGGVSYGTRMGHDLQFYRDIPIQPTGYGQALAILCLTEGLSE